MGLQVSLHDVQGPVAAVRHVPLIEQGEHPTLLDLQDALPLHEFLAPLSACKDAISAAVEALHLLPDGQPHAASGQRSFGPALQVCLPIG